MEKSLIIFAIMVFSTVSAQAYEVHYSITGHPSYVSYGGGAYTRSINNWGTNALFTPQNRIAAGRRMRAREFAKTYAQTRGQRLNHMGGYSPAVRTVQQKQLEISRFDKNYKISSGKNYTRNGITYYE